MRVVNRFARKLRRNETDTEKKLWHYLRNRLLVGFKFRRQHVIKPYVVDFCCVEKGLVIELDGGQHALQEKQDLKRTQALNRKGFKVLRFWDDQVLKNPQQVLEVIHRELITPHPALSPEGRGEKWSISPAWSKEK